MTSLSSRLTNNCIGDVGPKAAKREGIKKKDEQLNTKRRDSKAEVIEAI